MGRLRATWAHWVLQSACLTVGCLIVAQAALGQDTAPAGSMISANMVLSAAGLLVTALIGRWSWAQDKAIASADAKGVQALAEINLLRTEIANQYRPHSDLARLIEMAMSPMHRDMNGLKIEMAAFREQFIKALVGNLRSDPRHSIEDPS